ncbi:hypothetical protein [Sphaerisporangium corydalis]|uniref:GerMN domain-containing protein n=1 Tax=Sphaerisporangium corydalis TaxID=1441875 RepID=A0ABV9EGS5_9ACTN|nr:hypothetical protein [Sphaerisporangium corydalis]
MTTPPVDPWRAPPADRRQITARSRDRRHVRGRRAWTRRVVAALALVVAVLAAGCGITPTDVIDGGTPPVGFRPSTRLYFVLGSRLQPVIRPFPWPSLKETLVLLLDGPTAAERGRGLRSDLELSAAAPIKVSSGPAKVRITLGLPRPAAAQSAPRASLWLGQLTCTAASALAARTNIDPDAVTVVIQQQRVGAMGSFRCSQFPRGSD